MIITYEQEKMNKHSFGDFAFEIITKGNKYRQLYRTKRKILHSYMTPYDDAFYVWRGLPRRLKDCELTMGSHNRCAPQKSEI